MKHSDSSSIGFLRFSITGLSNRISATQSGKDAEERLELLITGKRVVDGRWDGTYVSLEVIGRSGSGKDLSAEIVIGYLIERDDNAWHLSVLMDRETVREILNSLWYWHQNKSGDAQVLVELSKGIDNWQAGKPIGVTRVEFVIPQLLKRPMERV